LLNRYRINLNISMAKLYSKKAIVNNKMLPKKETISFILNYSKALNIVKIGNHNFEVIAN
jgi:hypothetical protein